MEVATMKAAKLTTQNVEWQPAGEIFGPDSLYEGRSLTYYKVLSDRRDEGGGVAYLIRFSPPPGKLLRVIATARSDEHIYILEGGHANRAGEQIANPGTYGINPRGRKHSAFFGVETVALAVYTGEPDEVHELNVVERVAPDNAADPGQTMA
jgi:hypothetical protein